MGSWASTRLRASLGPPFCKNSLLGFVTFIGWSQYKTRILFTIKDGFYKGLFDQKLGHKRSMLILKRTLTFFLLNCQYFSMERCHLINICRPWSLAKCSVNNNWITDSNLRTDDGLLEALLDEVGVDVVAGAGRVPGVAVQTAVAKTVAKILEYLEELLRGVLVDGEDLRRLEVVHNEKRLLGIRLIAPKEEKIITIICNFLLNFLFHLQYFFLPLLLLITFVALLSTFFYYHNFYALCFLKALKDMKKSLTQNIIQPVHIKQVILHER